MRQPAVQFLILLFALNISHAGLFSGNDPEVSELPLSTNTYSVSIPYIGDVSDVDVARHRYFSSFTRDKVKYGDKRDPESDYQKFFELVRDEFGILLVRDGLYISRDRKGQRRTQVFTELQIDVNCIDRETYASCDIVPRKRLRHVGSQWGKKFAPEQSENSLILSLFSRQLRFQSDDETQYDLGILKGELTRQGIEARINEDSTELKFHRNRVDFFIRGERVKNGYYLKVQRTATPALDGVSADFVTIMQESSNFLEKLIN